MDDLNTDPDIFSKAGFVEKFSPANSQIKSQSLRKKTLLLVGARDILVGEYPPIKWVVPEYVSEGLSLLVGRQKLGKSWLALDWAVAVATGGSAMNSISCERGDVLYLDLENGERRINRRLRSLLPDEQVREKLNSLMFATSAPSLTGGLVAELETWRAAVNKPRLVVIDVFQRVRPIGKAGRNAYENDYECLAELQRWATANGLAVVILHHTRKGGAEDPLEAVNGSNGLSACADSTLVLDRNGNGSNLYVRGRDIEEKQTAMGFEGGHWHILGDALSVRLSDERKAIIDALAEAREPLSPTELALIVKAKNDNVRRLLLSMVNDGDVIRPSRGLYALPHSSTGR